MNINKIKKYDILYTTFDVYDDETACNIGKISICVNEILDDNMVLAMGRYVYRAEDLTDVKPERYHKFGENILKNKWFDD